VHDRDDDVSGRRRSPARRARISWVTGSSTAASSTTIQPLGAVAPGTPPAIVARDRASSAQLSWGLDRLRRKRPVGAGDASRAAAPPQAARAERHERVRAAPGRAWGGAAVWSGS